MTSAPPLVEVTLGPAVRAAFTTLGPRGEGYDLGLSTPDQPVDVLERRGRLAAWVGAPLALTRQVHGASVHHCTEPPPDGVTVVATADAIVTRRTDVAVAVLVADCVPVLLVDVGARVAGVVHAGRRGLVDGVVQSTVDALGSLGARPGELQAVIGPAICGECYEVPHAMQQVVDDAVPGTASTTTWGTPSLDLPEGVRRLLAAAKVDHVRQVGGCTLTDHRWYSHRGAEQQGRPRGRLAGVVRLLPTAAPGQGA
ncbi:polyphenol oxidase family protein [Actinotalea sp. K2]|uniref:polyphenol oxidase family protein n=1 Tax=Actinotalea sp. K2 TaxID=2939438 RepID=UPI0020183125|nr:polyphenol oxidase family protein [Actinotalea sp. K2]MCL3860117.1 polyphenol oxidase family protein [Actinotalea sp. K2]